MKYDPHEVEQNYELWMQIQLVTQVFALLEVS